MISSKWCLVRVRTFLATAGCAVAIALAGLEAYGAEVVHGNDQGGLLGEYVEKYRAMAARGDTLVVDGPCYSACTLALGIVDVCATPRASFGFHMAQSMTLFGYFPNYYWSRYMMAHYPPEIREWIVSKGGLTPRPEGPQRRGVSRPGSCMFIRWGGVPIPTREPPCACACLRLARGCGEPVTAAAERFAGNLRSRPTAWVGTRQNRNLLSATAIDHSWPRRSACDWVD